MRRHNLLTLATSTNKSAARGYVAHPIALLAAIVLLAAAVFAPPAARAGANADWDLHLAEPVNNVSAGADVVLRLTITNLSTRPGTLVLSNAICAYSLLIKDRDGRAVPATGCTNIYNASDRTLQPGGKVWIDLPLRQFITIRTAGRYKISVVGLLVREGSAIKRLPLASNEIELTLT
jgi:hypothetical protein